jgi:D-serine dehydratase
MHNMGGPINEQVVQRLRSREELLWINPLLSPAGEVLPGLSLSLRDIRDAEARLGRFAPVIAALFPDTRAASGVIESPVMPAPRMRGALASPLRRGLAPGRLYIKADHLLPVSGSVKARGGIYEVLCHAEELALYSGILREGDDYSVMLRPAARGLFGAHAVAVGSTGNLGLSIGTMAAALGFRATVHMSADAKAWKKDALRGRGVRVVEHASDYATAVKAGRDEAARDERTYFVDDERSPRLFLGYAVAALRLAPQLAAAGVVVDEDHPLFVYLPCGVGGAPGGITFGLKHMFGDSVHCFLAEPLESPCMTLGLIRGFGEGSSVYDIGLGNRTAADGLAVSRASDFAGRMISRLVSGCFTVSDGSLFDLLSLLFAAEGLRIEPSAAAGFAGPSMIAMPEEGRTYLDSPGLKGGQEAITHLVWTTGGSMVPEGEFVKFLAAASPGGDRDQSPYSSSSSSSSPSV